ncbi:NK-tumor recognition protein isoform X2 [Dendrobates tinctorius]|uniref:NK-tumor recognition protein isoform X2 n=1 Tax=Dendrobates tinctorius TaxID=92724 RepID=UPI003CC9BF78
MSCRMAEKARPQCFFNVEINREPVGRIVFQLFSDVCPKTCRNFLCLCTGEKGIGKVTKKKLCYKGSTFHRVVKSFMIQGGDFSEGNGKGGESVFGGYFKDENFILKHDRAFLLSMANRGKHTNGSQFFITTKPAPHLDGIHVVFGLVISGFEVIEQIENLKTDAASRPYADVRVIDCGILGSKSTKDEKIKTPISESAKSYSSSKSSSSSESSSSESEAEVERSKKRKQKKKSKAKRVKRRRKEGRRDAKEEKPQGHNSDQERNSTVEDKDSSVKRDKPVVRPEEIPPIPENRFLLRKDAPITIPEPEQKTSVIPETNEQNKGSITKSGRKIRGRGTIRYHTPPRSRSRSESSGDRESSETPPHWKEEMQRLKSYKPPTGEKWSKGDKLSEHLSTHWDEGSLSPRSRSNSWSHDGYHSDSSRERASSSKTRKKDKKVKHRKKSKKIKHTKKNKKKEESSGSQQEESSSRRRKYSQERKQRTSSRSSGDSSKRDWSRSDKEQKSSRHSSHSQSRSRSYSRDSGRSRNKSLSRRSTRSRSRSKSRSRRKNMSGSHSNSHSSKRTKTSSASPHKKNSSGSKSGVGVQPGKSANIKSMDESVLAFVTNENIHVISLSDSPPPSRWKPGQKPWKPSYERFQEIRTNASNALPSQSKYGASKVKRDSYRKKRSNSESERSDYSGRSSSYRHRSKDRSSSRSYSRSYTQSLSRSSSSSPTERAVSSSYNSSSSSESDDVVSSKAFLLKKQINAKGMKIRYKEKGEIENSVSPESTGSHPNASSSSDMEESKEFTKRLLKTTKALIENPTTDSGKEEEKNCVEELNMDQENSKTETDNTQTMMSNVEKVLESDTLEESVEKLVDEDTISISQNTNVTEEAASSGKEEGEASESDSEEIKPSNTPPPSEASILPKPSENLSKTPQTETPTPEHKSKSKKHKRRSGKKSMKKSRSKNKAKDKSKKNKEKKLKAQKKKQAFHWQPPLEFGEEEDEETGGDVQLKETNPKDLLLYKPSSAEIKNATDGSLHIDKIAKEPKIVSIKPAVKAGDEELLSKVAKNPLMPANIEQTSENIKAFTSHRSLPQIKQEASCRALTPANATAGSADQISSPSTSAPAASGESIQVKEENQPALSVQKVEADISETAAIDNKWKPVQGPTIVQNPKPTVVPVVTPFEPEKKAHGLRIEIKSINKVRPGSLFDEVRKTARLNQRPRNQESSSEERSSSQEEESRSSGKARSQSKSQTPSSHRSRSLSSSRSRSRSVRYSSSSRSRTRSRSRRRYSDYRSRTRSRSSGSSRSSRSRSRSVSYDRHRKRSRSRSYTYDSYDSRSRSRSRSPSYYRSRSYNRRSRSWRSSYSGSDRSYGHRRRHSGRS